MKYRELEILDIEESRDGNKFEVVFEVPGDKFDQSYAKRLKHSFPKKQRFLDIIDDNDTRRYEKIIRDLYLEKEFDREERGKVDEKLDTVREEARRKKIGNRRNP